MRMSDRRVESPSDTSSQATESQEATVPAAVYEEMEKHLKKLSGQLQSKDRQLEEKEAMIAVRVW